MKNARKPSTIQPRPDIYGYHDYRAFLKDWLAHQKASQSFASARDLAKKAGLASGYLPMVLNGNRQLSSKALAKLLPHLGLNETESTYLELMVTLGSTESQDARLHALERMKRFAGFKKRNPKEFEVHRYLTRWYYVAIREMAALEGFRPEPRWIQERLHEPVELKEIEKALKFLYEHGYLKKAPDGSVSPPDKIIDCAGGIYRLALTQFHREMFGLAASSIETVSSEERNIQGHTFAIASQHYPEALGILQDAITRIRDLGDRTRSGDAVYHCQLALFPLARRNSK